MQKYLSDILQTIAKTVQFDTSLAPAAEGAPFGEATAQCLRYFLSLAREMGFETHNYDGYCGEVVYGEGKDFALLAHLDVVPAGDGWIHSPFGGVLDGDKLYGRGTVDDKGPAVILLYCLKKLKDQRILPKRRFRLILGCNEETGWACMRHLKEVSSLPEEGFTPDASFPVLYAEKGILHLDFSFPLQHPPFTLFSGGSAVNMVCAYATSVPVKKARTADFSCPIRGVRLAEEGERLNAYGVSAHGSTPELGQNALGGLLAYYAREDGDCRKAYRLLFEDGAGATKMCDETGRLTISPNTALFADGVLHVSADIRYPATHTQAEVEELFARSGAVFSVRHAQPPLYNDPNGTLIQTLLSVYNRETGKHASPIAIGGGTYARVLRCGCGFGPEEADEPCAIHCPEECISLTQIERWSRIYFHALQKIGE